MRTGTLPACLIAIVSLVFGLTAEPAQQPPAPGPPAGPSTSFRWPAGKRAAVSLSFDDARVSQVDTGLAVLDRHRVKATFFLQAENIGQRLDGWKKAVATGHEIGNHTVTHPCTGNYAFSRHNALEDYSLETLAAQLDGANAEIERLLGVRPKTFAYPCGQKFVGRGRYVKSYVPLVAERFLVGRGYLDESANDPAFCDLSQAMGTPFDNLSFDEMRSLVEKAVQDGRWIIFVGHDIGKRGFQVTDSVALGELCDYLNDPSSGVWLGTVAEVGSYVSDHRFRAHHANEGSHAGR